MYNQRNEGDQKIATLAGAVAWAAGGRPRRAPKARPAPYHNAMARAVQSAAEVKNRRGRGKKETNIRSGSLQGQGRIQAIGHQAGKHGRAQAEQGGAGE